jgi:ubiquinone biosynthesis accessory factor UbiJ
MLMTKILSHLMSQNAWAKRDLLPYAGKTVTIDLIPFKSTLIILENGALAQAGKTAQADAILRLTPSVALRILANDLSAQKEVQFEGNEELAMTVAKVLNNFRWDYEEDLSHWIGDIPAHKMAQIARNGATLIKNQSIQWGEMLAEFWTEEVPLVAKKYSLEKFTQEVDHLRDDVARFEKRIQKYLTQEKA